MHLLKCLAHSNPLVAHFLSDRYTSEINVMNPLGTGGKLVKEFARTMRDMYFSPSSALSPTGLKRAIARFAPRFAGTAQHDAMELLAYLLDGLHEDMNRVRKKVPYVELPDTYFDSRPKKIEVEELSRLKRRQQRSSQQQYLDYVGADSRDVHRMRNDSIINDAFCGQFRSTCECPSCGRTSVSFEVFNHISLELPVLRVLEVLVFPSLDGDKFCRDGIDQHDEWAIDTLKVVLKVGVNATIGDFKRQLSEICGIAANRLALTEIREKKIRRLLDENNIVSTIDKDDVIAAYEINPYTDDFIHVVVGLRHIDMVIAIDENNQEHRNDDREKSVPKKKKGLVRFGFPILTSFRSNLSCAATKEHIWRLVRRYCTNTFEEEKKDSLVCSTMKAAVKAGKGAEQIPIRLVDIDDNPLEISNVGSIHNYISSNTTSSDSPILPTKQELLKRSLLPFSSTEISTYLGEECKDNFVFFTVDWVGLWNDLIDKETGMAFTHFPTPTLQNSSSNSDATLTLDDCFQNFTRPEKLDKNNMWYCSQCKLHQQSTKTISVHALPSILAIHLKRFDTTCNSFLRGDRLNTLVNFPLDNLDMSKHLSTSDQGVEGVPALYELFAITNHYGRMGYGHYTAHCRNLDLRGSGYGGWFLFDDATVIPVENERDIVTSAAYILFYQRRLPKDKVQ